MTALFQLAYSLYLLEHHDQMPARLVSRLRVPQEFRPAMYETIVASAFALAGSTIESAETKATDKAEPEFWATAQSGKRYAVEAKCRSAWRAACDPDDDAFRAELKRWVRQKLFDSVAKGLANPVYWFELSIGSPLDEAAWRKIQAIARESIDEVEAEMTARAAGPLAAAYVFITNNPHLVDDDIPQPPYFAILEPFLMDDLRGGRVVELEEAMETRDRHRDLTWVFDCLSEVQRIPQTFDGSPPELLPADGQPAVSMRIGTRVDIDFPDGQHLKGELSEITTLDDKAWVVVKEEKAKTYKMGVIPLTEGEIKAVRLYGDAIFGKAEKRRRTARNSLDLYDWFLDVYKDYSREGLLSQIPGHPAIETYRSLPLDELRIRVAREVAKAAHVRNPTPEGGVKLS